MRDVFLSMLSSRVVKNSFRKQNEKKINIYALQSKMMETLKNYGPFGIILKNQAFISSFHFQLSVFIIFKVFELAYGGPVLLFLKNLKLRKHVRYYQY